MAFDNLQSQRRAFVAELITQIIPSNPPAGDVILEIGCGHGHFLTAFAAEHTRALCIGVDIASDRIARASRKAARANLPHLHFIRSEASLFLSAMPDGLRLSRVFVLFPDPWPKLRHHKHRVMQRPFLTALGAKAAAGCELHFRTDFRPYFDAAVETVTGSEHWALVDAPWPFEFETVFQNRAESFDSFTARLRQQRP